VALLLGGCGASHPTTAFNRARITAYARAVNIHPSDVTGGFALGRPERQSEPSPVHRAVAECGGALLEEEPGTVVSEVRIKSRGRPLFGEGVSSGVQVVGSEAIAMKRVAADQHADVRACIERAINRYEHKLSFVEGQHVAIKSLPPGLLDVRGVSGLEVDLTGVVTGPTGRRSITHGHGYNLVFVSGPAEVTLKWSAPALTRRQQRRLVSMLYSRAKAQKL
jgi:hypothetical protein